MLYRWGGKEAMCEAGIFSPRFVVPVATSETKRGSNPGLKPVSVLVLGLRRRYHQYFEMAFNKWVMMVGNEK
jgi:hypothetical protein